ncbi:MAG: TolC family protein [Bacteroidetes bacterium]|nr:TolC family protein [Bacteroidota bacterium]
MKQIITLLIIACSIAVSGQSLTIDQCYTQARQNYPLVKQHELIQKTREYTVQNAWRGYIPQLNVFGQATYQSQTTNFADVFSKFGNLLPSSVSFPVYSKDQYRITGEVNQTLFDGLAGKYKKESAETQAEIQEQNVEVNLYSLKDRVNQVYFGVLLIDQQLLLNDIQQHDVQNGIDKAQALVNNGSAYRSSVDELKAQLLQVQQNKVELQSNRRSYLQVLSLLIGQQLDENTTLTPPQPANLSNDIRRPELTLYELQKKTYDVQSRQLNTALMPSLNAFFDGSYGRPTLNTVSNDFGAFWVTGIKLNWSLTALYTRKNNKLIYGLNQNDLDIQKEVFLFNTKITLSQQDEQISKYNELVANDQKIVDLRVSVKNASDAQLQNGVITGHDYLTQVDAEAQARLNLILHQVQLLQAQYNHQITSGN